MGDPFMGIEIQDNGFTVFHYGGSAWRWSQDITFKYHSDEDVWLLERINAVSFHAADPDSTHEDLSKTRADLGDVLFEEYDFESE